MRGYETLGKHSIAIHEVGKDDRATTCTVYRHLYKENYWIARYQKIYHRLTRHENRWHLTIKTHN